MKDLIHSIFEWIFLCLMISRVDTIEKKFLNICCYNLAEMGQNLLQMKMTIEEESANFTVPDRKIADGSHVYFIFS